MKNVTIHTFEKVKKKTPKSYSMFGVPFVKDDSCCDEVCKDAGRHHVEIIKKNYTDPKKEREELVQRLQSTPFFKGVITRGHLSYPRIGANTPPLAAFRFSPSTSG